MNVLAAEKLMQSPKLYATFLLWLLSELFEHLPEVGDLEKPKLVFFFDEAHLLFNEAPKALLEKVEQVVRLIRSKGVGVYFVHARTRSTSPRPSSASSATASSTRSARSRRSDQKAVKTAAQTLRGNPKLDTEKAIMELGVGEALVSLLDAKGTPEIVQRAFILPPASKIGPIAPEERKKMIASSVIAGHYEKAIDRESAYEKLKGRTDSKQADTPVKIGGKSAPAPAPEEKGAGGMLSDILFGSTGPRGGHREGVVESAAKSMARQAGREILRGMLGSILGGGKRR